ncbi:tetratricopeptide repeat protein [Tumidithrix helvetica PCC 7403]|uniref:SirB1 family protein n=1 Tax=Tumidithrix helvetica TaxID=3457545 RepID=UPI003CC0A7C2
MTTFNLSPARQKFWQVSRVPESDMTNEHLLEGALAIAWEEYPRIDLAFYRTEIDRMAEHLRPRIEYLTYPLKIIGEINQYLFAEQKFRGNETDYYAPCNSFITDVIEHRSGIPITLSIVYMAIGDRIDFPFVGVSLPGHFIIRPQREDVEIFVDPFHQGEILFKHDCAHRLTQVYGEKMTLRPEYLEPVGTRKILERMLTNLKHIYLRRGQAEKALAAIEKLLMLYPDNPMQQRDHGLLCYQLERFTEARLDLENYLERIPYAEDAGLIAKLIEEMN